MADMPSIPTDLQERVDRIRNDSTERLKRLALGPRAENEVASAEMGMLVTLLIEREFERDPEFLVLIEERRADLITHVEERVVEAKLLLPGDIK